MVPLDYLELNLSLGIGLLGDKFYPELNPVVSLYFYDRFNRPNHKVTFLYNNQFLAERTGGGFSLRTNSFISLFWSKNINFKGGTPSWLGIGGGFLVRRSGDYYTGKTAKFFISKDLGSGISLTPEFYLTNDFKNFQTGIRLSYTF